MQFAGEVVFVGRGYRCENGEITPLEVKVGDKVVFSYLDNSKIEIQGGEYWLIEENNIWFVFED